MGTSLADAPRELTSRSVPEARARSPLRQAAPTARGACQCGPAAAHMPDSALGQARVGVTVNFKGQCAPAHSAGVTRRQSQPDLPGNSKYGSTPCLRGTNCDRSRRGTAPGRRSTTVRSGQVRSGQDCGQALRDQLSDSDSSCCTRLHQTRPNHARDPQDL